MSMNKTKQGEAFSDSTVFWSRKMHGGDMEKRRLAKQTQHRFPTSTMPSLMDLRLAAWRREKEEQYKVVPPALKQELSAKLTQCQKEKLWSHICRAAVGRQVRRRAIHEKEDFSPASKPFLPQVSFAAFRRELIAEGRRVSLGTLGQDKRIKTSDHALLAAEVRRQLLDKVAQTTVHHQQQSWTTAAPSTTTSCDALIRQLRQMETTLQHEIDGIWTALDTIDSTPTSCKPNKRIPLVDIRYQALLREIRRAHRKLRIADADASCYRQLLRELRQAVRQGAEETDVAPQTAVLLRDVCRAAWMRDITRIEMTHPSAKARMTKAVAAHASFQRELLAKVLARLHQKLDRLTTQAALKNALKSRKVVVDEAPQNYLGRDIVHAALLRAIAKVELHPAGQVRLAEAVAMHTLYKQELLTVVLESMRKQVYRMNWRANHGQLKKEMQIKALHFQIRKAYFHRPRQAGMERSKQRVGTFGRELIAKTTQRRSCSFVGNTSSASLSREIRKLESRIATQATAVVMSTAQMEFNQQHSKQHLLCKLIHHTALLREIRRGLHRPVTELQEDCHQHLLCKTIRRTVFLREIRRGLYRHAAEQARRAKARHALMQYKQELLSQVLEHLLWVENRMSKLLGAAELRRDLFRSAVQRTVRRFDRLPKTLGHLTAVHEEVINGRGIHINGVSKAKLLAQVRRHALLRAIRGNHTKRAHSESAKLIIKTFKRQLLRELVHKVHKAEFPLQQIHRAVLNREIRKNFLHSKQQEEHLQRAREIVRTLGLELCVRVFEGMRKTDGLVEKTSQVATIKAELLDKANKHKEEMTRMKSKAGAVAQFKAELIARAEGYVVMDSNDEGFVCIDKQMEPILFRDEKSAKGGDDWIVDF